MFRLERPVLAVLLGLTVVLVAGGRVEAQQPRSFLKSLAAAPSLTASTVPAAGPAKGDQNPYGVAVVPYGFAAHGSVRGGDALVSNFNNAGNLQGKGTSIVAVTPSGHVSTFFAAPKSLGHVGLTTALVALRAGVVVVGNTPTTDGTSATVSQGSLIFLDARGKVVLNYVNPALQGPWDMTADERDPDYPVLYVSTVLNGTVVRLQTHVRMGASGPMVSIDRVTRIASGFLHRTDPNALLVGPTGLLLDADGDTLYVADTGNNRIQVLYGVRRAGGDLGAGRTVFSGAPLKGPLALAWSPEHTIIASNGDAAGDAATPPNMVVEVAPSLGRAIATRQLDTSGTPGAIFGITIARVGEHAALLYVNDNDITLNVLPSRDDD